LEPDCVVELDGLHFSSIISDKRNFDVLLEAERIAVDNPNELQWLLSVIDLDRISGYVVSAVDLTEPITGKFNYSESYIMETASLLAKGKVVAWFQGGSEFGPRALGRRSILADPRLGSMKGYINSEIKFREDFRPFAPSVLREDVGTYFKTDRESPYMILVDYVRDEWRHKIGGVVHENNTSRIQTVTPEWNLPYYELLKAFKEVTGISLLLNTSLNRRGMPIVETPEEALDFFYSCRLDYLVMDKYIVSK
jgi:predicted NodU family carbamoyl transferase